MFRIASVIVLVLSVLTSVGGKIPIPVGEGNGAHIEVDLNGDGKNEKIGWTSFADLEGETFYRLYVDDHDGNRLWSGPAVEDEENPYIFFKSDYGDSMPLIALDVDMDGNIELLAPEALGDIAPLHYRILRWLGDRFVALEPKVLMPASRERLVWRSTESAYGTWVTNIYRDGIDVFRMDLVKFYAEQKIEIAELLVRFDKKGAEILKWTKEFAPYRNDEESKERKFSGSDANTYIARIGHKDHYNSRGVKLKSVISILRQDRANYYKGNGDSEDSGVGIFDTVAKRSRIDSMDIYPVDISLGELEKSILHGMPLLKIYVDANKLFVKAID